MKIGFYNPYFDGLGGGERYTLTLAGHWSKKHEVVLFWDDPNIVGLSEKRFGLDLGNVRVVPNMFKNENIFGKLWESRKYDLIFFLSDGSIPASMARHNILHFQVPFPSVLTDPWKQKRYDAVVCNSEFTKRELDPVLGERAAVIYPPVQPVPSLSGVKRKKRILSVGRFTGVFQAKKQEVLIDTFLEGYRKGDLSGYELVLSGGLLDSDRGYFDTLVTRTAGSPIQLLPNITNDELVKLYRESTFYWHAAGYGETDPTRMEHFGITTAEAMSAGLVPLVYAAGGQLEIVTEGANGYFWKTPGELLDKTRTLIRDKDRYAQTAKAAVRRAEDFSPSQFTRAYDALIAGWK